MALPGTPDAPWPPRPRAAVALLTPSRLKVARACQRLHHFTYGLGYRPAEEPEALRFGTNVHKALEAWWTCTEGGEPRLEAALVALTHEAQGDVDVFKRIRTEELVRAYHQRWEGEQGRYEVLGVEQRFETCLRNPVTGQRSRTWRLAGRVDAVVRDRTDGRVLLVEHKTATGELGPGSDYWRRLRVDAQVSLYFEGARSLGHDVAGCVYDVLRRPAQRQRKATPEDARRRTRQGTLYAHQRLEDETPEAFRARVRDELARQPEATFARREVVRLEEEIAESLLDVWELGKQLRESERHARAPRNPDACFQYGRVCPFFGVCAGEASLDDPHLFTRLQGLGVVPRPDGQQPKEEAA